MSMPFVMNLACVNMRMTLKESLVAATINSAGKCEASTARAKETCGWLTAPRRPASLGRSKTHGSLEAGKFGDFIGDDAWPPPLFPRELTARSAVLDAPRWEHVTYQMVDPPITAVYKHGKLVHAVKAKKRGRDE
jgi:imidazolonepropionase